MSADLRKKGNKWIRDSMEAGRARGCNRLTPQDWLREFRIMVAMLSDHRRFRALKGVLIDDALKQDILRIACERMGFNHTFKETALKIIRERAWAYFESHMGYLERFCSTSGNKRARPAPVLATPPNVIESTCVRGCSEDGKVVFGYALQQDWDQRAFVYLSASAGIVPLPLLDDYDASIADDSDATGKIIVGSLFKYSQSHTEFDEQEGVIWTADSEGVYTVTLLGGIPGGTDSSAHRISSDGGLIGGAVWREEDEEVIPWAHLVLWRRDSGKLTIQDLGLLEGTTSCEVFGIVRDKDGNETLTGECRKGSLGNYAWIKSVKWSSLDKQAGLVDLGHL